MNELQEYPKKIEYEKNGYKVKMKATWVAKKFMMMVAQQGDHFGELKIEGNGIKYKNDNINFNYHYWMDNIHTDLRSKYVNYGANNPRLTQALEEIDKIYNPWRYKNKQ